MWHCVFVFLSGFALLHLRQLYSSPEQNLRRHSFLVQLRIAGHTWSLLKLVKAGFLRRYGHHMDCKYLNISFRNASLNNIVVVEILF